MICFPDKAYDWWLAGRTGTGANEDGNLTSLVASRISPGRPPHAPLVSVVMGVYNGMPHLDYAIDGILGQSLDAFELIVVNDGSTDGTRELLAQYAARDRRVRVIDQPNQGLTRALIRGCDAARGRYIARHDHADWSHPERIEQQVALFESQAEIALVSCWTRLYAPEGEALRVVDRDDEADETRFRASDRLPAVSHPGSVVFRAADYHRVGGYRREFYVAQDRDLWMRLTERGIVGFVPAVLYHARTATAAVPCPHAAVRKQLIRIIGQLSAVRQQGGDERPGLAAAAELRPGGSGWREASPGTRDYRVGRVLRSRGRPRQAEQYFRRAVRVNPYHLPARIALLGHALHLW